MGFQQNQANESTHRESLSVFPMRPNIAVTEDYMAERTRMIQQYLQSILDIRQLRYLEGVVRLCLLSV